MPAIERSAASAFAGLDVPDWLLTDAAPADNWALHLQAGSLWVAETEGRVVGFLAGRVERPRLHIDEIDVERPAQGQGVGRSLLSAAADWARAKGLKAMTLTTFRDVPWNAPFYARFGFQELEPASAPPSLQASLAYEEAKGLRNRCAMIMPL